MNSKQLISRDIEHFYNRASEETRLDKGMGIFEFERTKTLIKQHISLSSSKIIDVGGGTGKYAEWLANQGHTVYLVDPVLKHVQKAQDRANKLKNKFSVQLGEARMLNFPDKYADVVILHGPLYHLQKKEDRALAIIEARRVLKKGGIILGFSINYTASTLVGLLHGIIHKSSFFDMCKKELSNGIHIPPNDFPWLLAEAYYHKPEELKEEFINQQLDYINTYAIEGMVWLDKNYFSSMSDEQKKCNLTELIRLTQNDPNLLSLSPHMMIAVRKQDN